MACRYDTVRVAATGNRFVTEDIKLGTEHVEGIPCVLVCAHRKHCPINMFEYHWGRNPFDSVIRKSVDAPKNMAPRAHASQRGEDCRSAVWSIYLLFPRK